MSKLHNGFDPNSPGFVESADTMEARNAEVAEKAVRITQGGSDNTNTRLFSAAIYLADNDRHALAREIVSHIAPAPGPSVDFKKSPGPRTIRLKAPWRP